MHGLVSLLPAPYYQQVEALWQELETEHGLRGIHVTPLPHFSWHIAEDYDFYALEHSLLNLARSKSPIAVRTAGLGIFSGVRPVLYIAVVKDLALNRLHSEIWQASEPHAQQLSPHYQPQFWMPHISLAYEDLNADNLPQVVQQFAFRPFNWEMQIDNIALIYEPEGEVGRLKFHINFSASN